METRRCRAVSNASFITYLNDGEKWPEVRSVAMALNMLKHENTLRVSIATRRKRAGWDHEYLLKVLAQ